MKAIKVCILPQDEIRARALAIARGDLKPRPSDPKIWMTSVTVLAAVLSDDNRALLHLIRKTKPDSIESLAAVSGREPVELLRRLETLSRCGFVEIPHEKQQVRPIAKAASFHILMY